MRIEAEAFLPIQVNGSGPAGEKDPNSPRWEMCLRLENGDHSRSDKRGLETTPYLYLIVPRCPVEHVHDEPLRTEPGEDASEQRS